MNRTLAIVLGILLVAATVASWPRLANFRRQLQAQRLYDHAVGCYMLRNDQECESIMARIARDYADLPVGALARLKCAFLVYDGHGDRDRAEVLFQQFLEEHPKGVMYLADSPIPEYEGELELVAFYFLGRIAEDRGNPTQARAWFEKIIQRGSSNPANLIVGDTATRLRHLRERADNVEAGK